MADQRDLATRVFGSVTHDQLDSIEANTIAINQTIPKLAHDKLTDTQEKEWKKEDATTEARKESGSSSTGERTPSKTTSG